MRVLFRITVVLLLIGCSTTNEVVDKCGQAACNAMYREGSDQLGTMFMFENYKVRCYSHLLSRKAQCEWYEQK